MLAMDPTFVQLLFIKQFNILVLQKKNAKLDIYLSPNIVLNHSKVVPTCDVPFSKVISLF
jgi:hypothetical protein